MLPAWTGLRQRIEVLRGPQGSLYGAKSMGGTIRMITVQPDLGNPEGSIVVKGSSVTDGDTNSSFEGSFNIPIVEDQFAVRGTFYYGQNSGIFDRVYQSSWVEGGSGDVRQSPGPDFDKVENVDDETYWGGQLTGLIQITDNLTFSPKYPDSAICETIILKFIFQLSYTAAAPATISDNSCVIAACRALL